MFAILSNAKTPIDLSAFTPSVRYPSTALLERHDAVLQDVFVDASELPLGDPVLRGVGAAYAVLFDLPLDRALLSATADIAMIVGSLPGLLTDNAEEKLNARLRAAGLPPVALPLVEPPSEEDADPTDDMKLSPAARERIARHLAYASTRSTAELLSTLSEYNLAKKVWRPIRAPRWALEVAGRWAIALGFGVVVAVWNVALSRLLKMPRISGSVIARVFGFAAHAPATRLREWQTRDGQPLESPRSFVLELFGADMSAREEVAVEDAAEGAGEELPYAA